MTRGASKGRTIVIAIGAATIGYCLLASQPASAISLSTVDQSRIDKPARTRSPGLGGPAGSSRAVATTTLALARDAKAATVIPLTLSDRAYRAVDRRARSSAPAATSFGLEPVSLQTAVNAPNVASKHDSRPPPSAAGSTGYPLLFSGIGLIGLIVHRRMIAKTNPS